MLLSSGNQQVHELVKLCLRLASKDLKQRDAVSEDLKQCDVASEDLKQRDAASEDLSCERGYEAA